MIQIPKRTLKMELGWLSLGSYTNQMNYTGCRVQHYPLSDKLDRTSADKVTSSIQQAKSSLLSLFTETQVRLP